MLDRDQPVVTRKCYMPESFRTVALSCSSDMSVRQSISVEVECRGSTSCECAIIGSPSKFSSSETSITDGSMLFSIDIFRTCSCCQQLTTAPKMATKAQNHHDNPE